MHDKGDVVQTNVALQVPDAPGLLIPRGTYGRILRVIDGRVSLVHWQVGRICIDDSYSTWMNCGT